MNDLLHLTLLLNFHLKRIMKTEIENHCNITVSYMIKSSHHQITHGLCYLNFLPARSIMLIIISLVKAAKEICGVNSCDAHSTRHCEQLLPISLKSSGNRFYSVQNNQKLTNELVILPKLYIKL